MVWVHGGAKRLEKKRMQQAKPSSAPEYRKRPGDMAEKQRRFFASEKRTKLMSRSPVPVDNNLRSMDVQSLSLPCFNAAAHDPTNLLIPSESEGFALPLPKSSKVYDPSFDRPSSALRDKDLSSSSMLQLPPPASFINPVSNVSVQTPQEHIAFASIPKERRIIFIDQGVDRTDEVYSK